MSSAAATPEVEPPKAEAPAPTEAPAPAADVTAEKAEAPPAPKKEVIIPAPPPKVNAWAKPPPGVKPKEEPKAVRLRMPKGRAASPSCRTAAPSLPRATLPA